MKIKTRTRYRIIGSDFSAQEPRLTTFRSKDPNRLKAYLEGKDLYCVIAQSIFHTKYEDNLEFYPEGTKITLDGKEIICGKKTNINPEGKHRRKIAKMVLLALTYGMSASTLAQRIGQSKEEAQKIFDTFFTEFPNVKKLIDSSKEHLKKYGYVEDWAGRRRHLPDINLSPYEVKLAKDNTAESDFNPFLECKNRMAKDPRIAKYEKLIKEKIAETNALRRSRNPDWQDEQERPNKTYDELAKKALKDGVLILANTGRIAQADRQCLNARIQGGAASLTKLAMVNVYNDKIRKDCMARRLISVHDELLVEAPLLYADTVEKRLPQIRIDTAKPYINVPMSCDPYCVPNWYSDTYSNAIQAEFEKLMAKQNDHDKCLAQVISNHPEIPKPEIVSCIMDGKEINLENYDN